MIGLSPIMAVMLYFGITLACVIVVWIVQYCQARKKIILPPEKQMHVCEFCHFAYLESLEKNITRCPCCKSFNAKKCD